MNVLFNDEILIIVKSLREAKTISDIFKEIDESIVSLNDVPDNSVE